MKRSLLIISVLLAMAASCSHGSTSRSARIETGTRPCINLNTASRDELQSLPGVGEVLAGRIIEFREKNGPFRRPQDLIIVEGVSEKLYRRFADRVCV